MGGPVAKQFLTLGGRPLLLHSLSVLQASPAIHEIILAVPVAPREVLASLASACDDIVCLATPEPFGSVGQHYRDFEQTSDEEVIRLLDSLRLGAPA